MRSNQIRLPTDSLFPEIFTGILAALSLLHEVAASEFQVGSGSECTRRAGEPVSGADHIFSQAFPVGVKVHMRGDSLWWICDLVSEFSAGI